MEQLAVVLGIAGALALLGAIVYLAVQQQKKRTAAMKAVADRLGWGFQEKAPMQVIPGPERFGLFSEGRSRTIRNFFAGEMDGMRAAVFDYSYTVGSGKHQQTWNQTVVYLDAGTLDLPSFSLRPENVFHRIATVFGYQDIDLQSRPDFSRKYLLRGPDEGAVRAAFQDDVMEFYEQRPKCCSEAQGQQLFFWRAGKIVPPEQVPALIDEGRHLLARLHPGPVPRSEGGARLPYSGPSDRPETT